LQTISFQVKSDVTCLEEVLSKLEKIKQDWIEPKDWLQCQLALAEGFTNAVRHAHKELPADIEIEIAITLSNSNITIKIWDYGAGFDLNQEEKSLAQQNQELLSGGRGIAILKRITDKLSYARCNNNRNCLIIYKELTSQDEVIGGMQN
jgi:serine/threonine-protein kinase RsbW